jgi:hypothetical protein
MFSSISSALIGHARVLIERSGGAPHSPAAGRSYSEVANAPANQPGERLAMVGRPGDRCVTPTGVHAEPHRPEFCPRAKAPLLGEGRAGIRVS